ncbi:MAG: 3-dehydroquinate synthase [Oscillospiraceae bacterium]|nr:3-dehydroquinate synthase [Oscillospiraceae bacterium]
MKKIAVKASKPYEVLIEQGLLSECGRLVSEVTKTKFTAVITDDNVDAIYSERVISSLEAAGFRVVKFVFPHGEKSKCSDTLNSIYGFLAENGITRADSLIALGGGVVGDITGYAAATFLRGLSFIQIPTTLLAQIDSSVGGKTAIDLPCGKNLVGAFKQPELVICDPLTLKTLSPEIVSDGMAEAIKYGMIRSSELFELIASHSIEDYFDDIDDIICSCVSIKRDVVENDEFDRGERMLLNFGHTLGHAVESYYNYETYTHGNAVAAGMHMITEQAVKSGECDRESLEKLDAVITSYRLPLTVDAPYSGLIPLCSKDKKCESTSINAIICSSIGTSFIKKMPFEDFRAFMEA